jgi:hypothetical protein
MDMVDRDALKAVLTPKNIGIAVVTLLVVGFMGYRLADYYGVINAEKPSTDPAVIDPTSTYTPEEKKQVEKLKEQQQLEEQMPNRPPPAGS